MFPTGGDRWRCVTSGCHLCLSLVLFVPATGWASGAGPFRYKEGERGKGKLTACPF